MIINTKNPITLYKFKPDIKEENITSFELFNLEDVFLFVVESYSDHYTGGRYHIFEIALALCQLGKKVIWLSNCYPIYLESFKEYECLKNLIVIVQQHGSPTPFIFDKRHIFKHIVGTPLGCITNVAEYKRLNPGVVTYYQVILVVPPLARQFRGGVDVEDSGPGWSVIKESIRHADVIITQTNLNREWIVKWLDVSKKKIHIIPPAINDKVASKYLNSKTENEIVFISRFVSYKNPQQVLEVLKDINYDGKITMIGGAGGLSYSQFYEYAQKHNLNLSIIDKCSDYEKFQIISRCKLLLYPTTWEDFGMPPLEAGYYGIQTVTYQNPTFDEVYKHLLCYARRDNIEDFRKLSKKLITNYKLNFELRGLVLSNYTFKSLVNNVERMLISKKISTNLNEEITILFDIVSNCTDRGVGDVLLTTPVIKALKEKFPNSKIHYYAHKHNYQVLLNNQYIDKIITDDKNLNKEYSYHLTLERKLEDYSIDRNKLHRLDSLGLLFNVELEDKKLILNLSDNEVEYAKRYMPNNNKKNIVIMFKTTSEYRNWPLTRFRELVDKLKLKYNVIIVGKNYEPLFDDVYNLTNRLSLRELCSVIYLSDLVVSLDTSGIHIAGVFDKTCVGIFGIIPSEHRIKYYKNQYPLDGERCEDFCWDTQNKSAKNLKWCLDNKTSKCILSITVNMVYNKIRSVLK